MNPKIRRARFIFVGPLYFCLLGVRAEAERAACANEVTVIDTETNAVVARIGAGEGPWGVAVGP